MSGGLPLATDGSLLALDSATRQGLAAQLGRGLTRARSVGRPILVACTLPAPALPAGLDPSAVACASRRPGEPWFCFEQPERDGAALAALGEVTRLESAGVGRFAEVSAAWRALACEAVTGGVGVPVAVGGFAFSDGGGASRAWDGFAPASLSVPEIALIRRGGEVSGLLCALVAGDDTVEGLLDHMESRIAALADNAWRALPLLDPAPAGEHRLGSAMPPEHYESAIARARELIASGELEKIVLAREVHVHAPRPYEPGAVFGALRELFPSCFSFCVGRGDAAVVGASPELLLRREGQRVSTMALAGSTRRSADPAVDAHLGEQLTRSAKDREEQAIVARRIERSLRERALWVAATPEPVLVRVANIQHLGTPIRAQLAEPRDAIELLELLHPTPAVGGEPSASALRLIPALEGLDRGWYSGPLGWVDATGDGEFCVALRCALLRGNSAHCYVGAGIVRESDPAVELAETEVKLQALLPLLAG